MSVQKPTHTDISVSNDLWNVKLTFIGRSLLNPIHFYLSLVGAIHIFLFIFCIIVVNRSREHVRFVLSAAHQSQDKTRDRHSKERCGRNTAIGQRKTILLKDLLTNYKGEKNCDCCIEAGWNAKVLGKWTQSFRTAMTLLHRTKSICVEAWSKFTLHEQ